MIKWAKYLIGEKNKIGTVGPALPGTEIIAEQSDKDMYAAIDILLDKTDQQIIKHKEKNTAKRSKQMLKRASIEIIVCSLKNTRHKKY